MWVNMCIDTYFQSFSVCSCLSAPPPPGNEEEAAENGVVKTVVLNVFWNTALIWFDLWGIHNLPRTSLNLMHKFMLLFFSFLKGV